jgi:hypothetical protein
MSDGCGGRRTYTGVMDMLTLRPLWLAMLGACLSSCAPAEPPATPEGDGTAQASDVEHQQLELEQRRQRLEAQVLSELRLVRARRQASMNGAAASDDEPASADYELLLFGGPLHEVFLGCLCDGQRPDSVFNLSGEHGSDLSEISIRNKFAPYGSNYDDTSACNAAAKQPPIVVTSDGKSLGLLTVNASLKRRISTPTVAD